MYAGTWMVKPWDCMNLLWISFNLSVFWEWFDSKEFTFLSNCGSLIKNKWSFSLILRKADEKDDKTTELLWIILYFSICGHCFFNSSASGFEASICACRTRSPPGKWMCRSMKKRKKNEKNEKFVLNFVNYSIFFLFENFEWGTFQQKFLNICLSICLFRATYGCQSESQTFSLDKTTEDFHGMEGGDTIFPF